MKKKTIKKTYLQNNKTHMEIQKNQKKINLKNDPNYLMYAITSTIFKGICNYENEEKNKNCQKLLEKFQNFIWENSNKFVFFSLDAKCLDSLTKGNTMEKFLELFGASGKNLEDYGLRSLCQGEGHEYYFFNLKLADNIITSPQVIYLLNFLQIRNYSFGICIVPYCKNFFNNFFDENKNKPFFSYLENQGIESLKIMKEPKSIEFSNLFKILIYICLIYIALRIFISLLNFLISMKKNKINEEEINLLANFDNNYEDNIINNEEYSNVNESNKCCRHIKNFIKELYNIFSFRLNFTRLIDIEYIFYNEKNMENFSYWKCLILLLLCFNYVISIAIKMPHRDYFNSKNFTNISFIFYKLTIYAIDCYIALEASIFIYRLMNYVKKNGNSFKVFLKFYLFSLPKIFLFFLIFFTFQLQIENYGKNVDDKYSFYQNFIYKLKKKECYCGNPFIIFDYFNLVYTENNSEKYLKCFSWVYVNINMFLSFSFFIFIFYFSLRIKKKYFDYLVTIIFLCLFFTLYLNFMDLKESEYKLSFLQGEILSIKKLHLFCIKYFMGVITGLFFFYANDILLNDSYISNKDNYLPFEFIFLFLKFLNEKQANKIKSQKSSSSVGINNNNIDNNNTFTIPSKSGTYSSKDNLAFRLRKSSSNIDNNNPSILRAIRLDTILIKKISNKKNIIFMALSIISMLLLISYGFIRMNIEDYNGRYLPIKLYFDLWLLYIFERFLFLFNFLIFIITISSINIDTGSFKVLLKSKFFIIFGQIDSAFFSMLEIIVLFFFTIYNIQLYFSYQILFFISLGISISLFSMSLLFIFMFELPLKVLLKRIL